MKGDYFYADLERFNAALRNAGAVVTHDDGFVSVDPSKVPEELLSAYRRLLLHGAANGLL